MQRVFFWWIAHLIWKNDTLSKFMRESYNAWVFRKTNDLVLRGHHLWKLKIVANNLKLIVFLENKTWFSKNIKRRPRLPPRGRTFPDRACIHIPFQIKIWTLIPNNVNHQQTKFWFFFKTESSETTKWIDSLHFCAYLFCDDGLWINDIYNQIFLIIFYSMFFQFKTRKCPLKLIFSIFR